MNNSDDLESIWVTAKTDSLPASDEMIQIITGYRNKTLQRKLTVILISALSVAILIGITTIFEAKMPTTRIGQYLFILAGSVLVLTNVRSIKRFYDFQDFSNRDFITFLEKSRQNQAYFYKKTQVAGLAFWSCGLLFYIFEFVRQSTVLCITAYSLTAAFLVILWVIVRKRVYIKRAGRLEEMIKRLESLLNQL